MLFPIALHKISKIFIKFADFRTVFVFKIQLFVTDLRFSRAHIMRVKTEVRNEKWDLQSKNSSEISDLNANFKIQLFVQDLRFSRVRKMRVKT